MAGRKSIGVANAGEEGTATRSVATSDDGARNRSEVQRLADAATTLYLRRPLLIQPCLA